MSKTLKGFTIIEVMLVLALTGLLLIGVLSGTYKSIATQRYNDSVYNFAEYLRNIYSEVISPQSLGAGNSKNYAIFGKVIVFGHNNDDTSVYSATLVGGAKIPYSFNTDFIGELATVGVQLYCGSAIGTATATSTAELYTPLWEARLGKTNDTARGAFKGTVIIARSPSSGAVHTIFTDKTYDLAGGCTPSSSTASTSFKDDLAHFAEKREHVDAGRPKFSFQSVGICVNSENSVLSREVRIAEDGRNTSAISILPTDDGGNQCK